ncbi:hypothetical protein MKW92_032110 [Papaver armeniacum]|nr:hypothetical protein MKW92_032110 [Papaver armeniacum]
MLRFVGFIFSFNDVFSICLGKIHHRWTMDNISQQLEEQNNEALVMAVNEKPDNDINNQILVNCRRLLLVAGSINTLSSAQTVEALQDKNVRLDRDEDTMRICYMCSCERKK